MWTFTNRGFYSVVRDAEDPTTFVVRARAKGDLENLRSLIPGLRIVELGPTRDYQYRAFVAQDDWERAMVELIRDIDYGNFKDSVTERQGRARHDVYLRIWSAALSIGRIGRKTTQPTSLYDELSEPWDDAIFPPSRPEPDFPARATQSRRRQKGKGRAAKR